MGMESPTWHLGGLTFGAGSAHDSGRDVLTRNEAWLEQLDGEAERRRP
jgi:hypothetical protein